MSSTNEHSGSLGRVFVIACLVAIVIALCVVNLNASKQYASTVWPLASRTCLSSNGVLLTNAQLIEVASQLETEYLSPPKKIFQSDALINWYDDPSKNFRIGEYSEYYAQRQERAANLGLKKWAIVNVAYKEKSGKLLFLSEWLDPCGERFG